MPILKGCVSSAQILRAGMEEMISSVRMFPSTMEVDLFVTAFGLLAPGGQLIRTGGHMHHSTSAMALSGTLAVPTLLPHALIDKLMLCDIEGFTPEHICCAISSLQSNRLYDQQENSCTLFCNSVSIDH